MKIILLQDVPNVGRKNEIKEVSPGFARNFLFAKKLAEPATEGALQNLQQQKSATEKKKTAEQEKYHQLIAKLNSITLNFKIKVGEKGQAFGSISKQQIMEALKKQGIEIEKDWILLDGHIKATGEQTVQIKFPPELIGEVKIKIEAE